MSSRNVGNTLVRLLDGIPIANCIGIQARAEAMPRGIAKCICYFLGRVRSKIIYNACWQWRWCWATYLGNEHSDKQQEVNDARTGWHNANSKAKDVRLVGVGVTWETSKTVRIIQMNIVNKTNRSTWITCRFKNTIRHLNCFARWRFSYCKLQARENVWSWYIPPQIWNHTIPQQTCWKLQLRFQKYTTVNMASVWKQLRHVPLQTFKWNSSLFTYLQIART